MLLYGGILYIFIVSHYLMKKIVAFIFLLGTTHFAASAKEKHRNTIKVYVNNFIYPEINTSAQIKSTFFRLTPVSLMGGFWQQLGVGYQRNVYKRWDAGLAYYRWNNTGIFHPDGEGQPVSIQFGKYIDQKGLSSRYSLSFYDCSVIFNVISKKKHKFKIGLSVSWQKGYAEYVDSVRYINGSFPHGQIYWHSEYHEYLGYIPSLSYDFSFLKDYACVGADIRARRYFNYGNYTQVDFGIHIGVKFGDPHFRKRKAADIVENKK